MVKTNLGPLVNLKEPQDFRIQKQDYIDKNEEARKMKALVMITFTHVERQGA